MCPKPSIPKPRILDSLLHRHRPELARFRGLHHSRRAHQRDPDGFFCGSRDLRAVIDVLGCPVRHGSAELAADAPEIYSLFSPDTPLPRRCASASPTGPVGSASGRRPGRPASYREQC
ncbi:MAG: hypothetical protein ACTSRS_07645 [Candidatus Helarchaeota archaeon]